MGILQTMNNGRKRIATEFNKNKPFWYTTLGVIGVGLVAGVVYKESPDLHDIFRDAVKDWEKAQTGKEKATVVVDTAAKSALHVIKIAVVIGGTVYFIVASYKESKSRILAFASLAAGSQLKLEDFKEATKELIGEKKMDKIEEKVAEKEFKRAEPEINRYYSDADFNNPDIIVDDQTGAMWPDKYINVLDAIDMYFTEAKTGTEVFYPWRNLYSHLNYNKDGNSIRVGKMFNDFGVYQSDLKDIKHAQDFIKVVQAGPNRYKMILQIKKRPNPDGYTDEDGTYWDQQWSHEYDDMCGDGDWNSSLNPAERV